MDETNKYLKSIDLALEERLNKMKAQNTKVDEHLSALENLKTKNLRKMLFW